jgi:hypothetical protein
MKEKKQQFHLTMEKALGGLRVGRGATATMGVGGSKMAASAANDDNSVPPTSTDDPQQQIGKTEQATDVVTSQDNTSSASDQQRIAASVTTSYCFISIEEEINNNINSTPSTDKHCFSLLKRFYDELMTPAFPLEEERDDISDWLWCFSTQMHSKQYPQQNPTTSNDNDEGNERRVTKKKNNTENQRRCVMDVILMIQQQQQQQDSDNDNCGISNKQSTILGGAVIAYYRNSRVGLLSYVVLNEDYRGCGLAKKLHNEALRRMEMLANSYCLDSIESSNYNNNSQNTTAALRAIFAETNTHTAGDITPTQCLLRHKSLYNLGYRRVNFPYSQPPLSPEDGSNASFDDIMLLVYLPLSNNDYRSRMNQNNNNNESSLMRYCSWFFEKNEIHRFVDEDEDDDGNESSNNRLTTTTVVMDVNIPLGFIEDFYISQGFRRDATCGSDYRTADNYKFAHWFADRCHLKQQEQQGCGDSGVVEVSLHRPNIAPWEDIKESLLREWTEEVRKNKPQDLI